MTKTAFITGATSGIGKATAKILAKNGINLIINGRRSSRLKELKKQLMTSYSVEILELCFDVRNKEEVNNAINNLSNHWRKIDILVNNAGLAAGLDHIQDGNIDNWERMIDTNIKGLLYVSRAILPNMVKNGQGHVVNIASTAGKEVYENGNVYCSTKHAVDALSKAMRIDLLAEGIKVTSINPGMVETEFSIVRFDGDKKKAKIPYKGIKPLSGEDIAEIIWFALNRPDHVNINDIIITPKAQANSFLVHRKNQ